MRRLILAVLLCIVPLSASTLYLGTFSGNDQFADVQSAILFAGGSVTGLTLYDKSDDAAALVDYTPSPLDGPMSGTWDVIDDSVMISYLTVKASDASLRALSVRPAAKLGYLVHRGYY